MSAEAKRLMWLILRVIGMILVILSIATWVHRMVFVLHLTGDSKPLLLVSVGSAVLFYWAYRVIWLPMNSNQG